MAILSLVATSVATAILVPAATTFVASRFTKYVLTGVGKFGLTWLIMAILYDQFVAAGRDFNNQDFLITGASAGAIRVLI